MASGIPSLVHTLLIVSRLLMQADDSGSGNHPGNGELALPAYVRVFRKAGRLIH